MKTTVRPDFVFEDETLNRLDFPEKQVITLTCHRRENYGAPMEAILTAVRTIVEENPNVEVVYPVHLSPVVQDCAHRLLGDHPRIHLIAPLDVAQMHNLMPVPTCPHRLRRPRGSPRPGQTRPGPPGRETERPEAIAAGTAKLAGVETEPIVALTQELLQGGEAYARMAHAVNPYGDGKACGRIADAIAWHFGVVEEKPWSFGE